MQNLMISRCSENSERNVPRFITYMYVQSYGQKGIVTEITWPFNVSVFEKLGFRLSTLHHLAGVFKFLHSGDRFRKALFSVNENAVLVCLDGWPNQRKKDAFSHLSGLVWTGP